MVHARKDAFRRMWEDDQPVSQAVFPAAAPARPAWTPGAVKERSRAHVSPRLTSRRLGLECLRARKSHPMRRSGVPRQPSQSQPSPLSRFPFEKF